MQRLIYQGAFNLSRLHESLAATPWLMQGDTALYMLDIVEGGVSILVPDEIDGQTVADLISAHDPTPDPEPEPAPSRDEQLLAAVDAAKAAVAVGKVFSAEQAAVLAAVFDGLGKAITGEAS